jgi:kynurenine 3-monooxygenase
MIFKHRDMTIVGAGLVGSLLACFLTARGNRTKLFERRPDIRKGPNAEGRSINLALSDRGIRALEQLGLMDEIKKICIPMHGRYIHHQDGKTGLQPYGKEGQFINSVSRAELNRKLLDLAEKNGTQIYFDHRCEEIDWTNKEILFSHNGGKKSSKNFDLLFGADGAFSAVRLQYQLKHDRFQYSQHYIDYGYKELHIPSGKDGSFRMEKNALHIWPRGKYMLIALPNIDGSFTCTLFFPFDGDLSFSSLDSEEKLLQFFKDAFPDTIELMPNLSNDFFTNPTGSLVTVKCYPWIWKKDFALIGDAAHAIVPFFGQGMNCGFEDCTVLDQLMEKNNGDWDKILPVFQEQRKPDADAIAELALNNFIEMRDKVADPQFILQKKVEARLHEAYPDRWIPAYSQVTFNPQIRYSEALRRGRKQDDIMHRMMIEKNLEQEIDNPEVLREIIEQLAAE